MKFSVSPAGGVAHPFHPFGSRLPARWFVRPVILGVAAFLMLLALAGYLGLRGWHERQAASDGVEHSRQVIDTLDRMRAHLTELETRRRNYLMTLDPTSLDPYGVSEDSVRRDIDALQILVADDPLQSLRAAHLATIVAEKLQQIDRVPDTARASGLEAALATLRGMGEIQPQIDQMVDNERFLLVHWLARGDASQQSTIWLISAAVVLASVFAAAALALARVEAGRRRKSTEQLELLRDVAERRASDLQEREAKIRRLVDSNIIGISIWDFDGRVVEANDAWLDIGGYGREDLASGRIRWNEMTPIEWRPATESVMRQMRETGSSRPYEKELLRKDGSRVPVLVGNAALEGARDAGVSFVLDLTELKRAEAALRRSEASLAQAQQISRTGSWRWNVGTGEVSCSAELFRIFGYDPATAQPSYATFMDRVRAEDRASFEQALERAVRDRSRFQHEYRIALPDGSVKHLHSVGQPDIAESGGLEFVGTVIDITERKRAEHALRDSEERWRHAFENNPTMYFMVGAAGAILSVNPFGAEQLGYEVAELVGRPVLDVFVEADRDIVRKNVARCLEQFGRSMSWEARKVRKDGAVLWVRETARAVERSKNQPILLVACEDISERKRTDEALRSAQAELARVGRLTTMGELVASIAHEINQPLAAIVASASACLRWLNRSQPDLDKARSAISRIERDGSRAGDVIRGLRALARRSGPELATLDVNDAIREVLVLTRHELQQHGVVLHTDLLAGDRPVLGDRVQLQQVMLNLIVNGMEAMNPVTDRPRVLTISSRPTEPDGVMVAVEDSGAGLDPATADRIFDPFFTTKPNGMGMGLSICRSIIDAHGGRFWVAPRVPCGTIFRFTVPRVPSN
jgi:PAS domain S-box-containing protein